MGGQQDNQRVGGLVVRGAGEVLRSDVSKGGGGDGVWG